MTRYTKITAKILRQNLRAFFQNSVERSTRTGIFTITDSWFKNSVLYLEENWSNKHLNQLALALNVSEHPSDSFSIATGLLNWCVENVEVKNVVLKSA